METVSAADQENRRKPPRAGSVPPRATTPVNSLHSYVPGSKTGVVTPAVRPGSSMASHSAPNKRPRLGEATSGQYGSGNGRRVPLESYRGGNGTNSRAVSPSKIPSKTPNGGGSSLPRPVGAGMAMPIPKPGTQHHALGHGRVPSGVCGAGVGGGYSSQGIRSASTASSMGSGGYNRYVSGRGHGVVTKKASRARRESFKPRPSADGVELGMSVGPGGGRWGGFPDADCVKEEDEGY
jgi:protein regulator of cytokinesis 1